MRFTSIKVGAGATTPDPRSAPSTVPPEFLVVVPPVLTGTDQSPAKMCLTLEGTAANTLTVQPWVLDETTQKDPNLQDDPKSGNASRLFYSLGATQVVTVGAVAQINTVPGTVYLQVTVGPAAAATLKVGYS